MKLVRKVVVVVLCVVFAVCCFIIVGELFPPATGETEASIAVGKIWLTSAVLVASVSLLLLRIVCHKKDFTIR